MTLTNERFSLTVDVGDRIVPRRLADRKTRLVYSDAPYSYTLRLECDGKVYQSDSLLYERHERITDDGGGVRFEGRLDFGPDGPQDILLQQVFRIAGSGASFEETLSLRKREAETP